MGRRRKMAENRQRLVPWLIAKIDGRSIPGLYWKSKDKKIFRIPWKHGGKQDWSPEHSQIFMEWAIHTGKHRENVDAPQWATWKTRLRCAFNKARDIVELKTESDVDCADPYKIYQIRSDARAQPKIKEKPPPPTYVAQTPTGAPVLPAVLGEFNISNESGDLLQQLNSLPNSLKDIKSSDLIQDLGDQDIHIISTGSTISLPGARSPDEEAMETEVVETDPNEYPTDAGSGAPPGSSQASPFAYQCPQISSSHSSPVHHRQATSPPAAGLPDASTTATMQAATPGHAHHTPASSSPRQGDIPIELSLMDLGISLPDNSLELVPTEQLGLEAQEFRNLSLPQGDLTFQVIGNGDLEPEILVYTEPSIQPYPDSNTQGHEMYIRVNYSQDNVMEEYILNPKGCRLKYGSDADVYSCDSPAVISNILGPVDAQVLHLPDAVADDLRRNAKTNELLQSTRRGFLMECVEGDIFVTRYCRTVLYYYNSLSPHAAKLQRRTRTKVFDMTTYKSLCQRHIGEGKELPEPEAYLSVGQQPCFPTLGTNSSLIVCTLKSVVANDYAVKSQDSHDRVQTFSMDEDENSVEMPLDMEHQYIGRL